MYRNPLVLPVPGNPDPPVPDPGVSFFDGEFYLTCTGDDDGQNPGNAFRIYKSQNLVTWTYKRHAFRTTDVPWATGSFWGPELHKMDDGFYVLFYTARDRRTSRQQIGLAWTDSLDGEFKHLDVPIVVNEDVGVIDSTLLRTVERGVGDAFMLYWKVNGNVDGKHQPTWIMGHRLPVGDQLRVIVESGSPKVFSGPEPRQFIKNDMPWEGDLIEAPFVIKYNDKAYLFYSSPTSDPKALYAMGLAISDAVDGTYVKVPRFNPFPVSLPWIAGSAAARGPGSCSVIACPNGKYAMLYHVAGTGSRLFLDEVEWRTVVFPFPAPLPYINDGTNIPSTDSRPDII